MSEISKVERQFNLRIRSIELSCKRADKLYAERKILLRDYDLIYESSFLSAMTFFEESLERFLIHMIHAGRGPNSGCRALVAVNNKKIVKQILLRGEDYLQVLPLNKLVKLSQTFLSGPIPFDISDQGDRSLISQSVTVRNAIAHKSEHALETFRHKVNGVGMLPTRHRYPGAYLRHVYRSAPSQTRHESLVAALRKVIAAIGSSW